MNNYNSELVYGRNPVLEIIEKPSEIVQINKIWLAKNIKDKALQNKVINYARENKIPFRIIPFQNIDKLTNNKNHQGIALSISPVKYVSVEDAIKEALKLVLVAHEIEDTHNLGAMIRTFVAGGGKGIILTGRSSVGINSTVIKTSAGALFQAKFARSVNCLQALNKLKENGFWILGTDNSSDSKSLYDIDIPEQIAIVVGNEHKGLGQLIKKNCDFLLKVPISKNVDSLNVSVAFGIILFEILRRFD